MRSSRRRGAAGLVAALSLTVTVSTQSITREEALAGAFPGAEIRAERVFLTDAERERVRSLAGVEAPSALVARYLASRGGQPVGRAYIDTHVVRTKRETLLIALGADGRVRRIDVTAFLEPPEYAAPGPWMRQFDGRALDEDLRLHRAIRPIGGATLTARSTTDAVRRVLAIDRVLRGETRTP